MKNYLSNAFSLQMLPDDALIRVTSSKAEEVPEDCISCIGHASTAAVIGQLLGREVPCNRVSITLGREDVLYVAQYHGPRLEEGVTVLPAGANITFVKVRRCADIMQNQADDAMAEPFYAFVAHLEDELESNMGAERYREMIRKAHEAAHKAAEEAKKHD